MFAKRGQSRGALLRCFGGRRDPADRLTGILELQFADELKSELGILGRGSSNDGALGVLRHHAGNRFTVFPHPFQRADRIAFSPSAECRRNDMLAHAAVVPGFLHLSGDFFPIDRFLVLAVRSGRGGEVAGCVLSLSVGSSGVDCLSQVRALLFQNRHGSSLTTDPDNGDHQGDGRGKIMDGFDPLHDSSKRDFRPDPGLFPDLWGKPGRDIGRISHHHIRIR